MHGLREKKQGIKLYTSVVQSCLYMRPWLVIL